jgi:hypothetical protein
MRARALLMRKGMAAWMRCVGAESRPVAAPRMASATQPLPVGIDPQLVDILATMALATTLEVMT